MISKVSVTVTEEYLGNPENKKKSKTFFGSIVYSRSRKIETSKKKQ